MMAKRDAERGSVSARVTVLLGLCGLLHCQPTPDYRLTLRDIPADTAVLLLGWKSESDTVPKTSLAVPVVQLGPDERGSYTVSLDVGQTDEGAGVVSVATVDKNLCLTSVVSSALTPRSSRTSVSMLDIELDPAQNPDVVQRAIVPSPPVACPQSFPAGFPYSPPMPCARPGLSAIPSEPTLVSTRPVVMNVLRQLRGQARV